MRRREKKYERWSGKSISIVHAQPNSQPFPLQFFPSISFNHTVDHHTREPRFLRPHHRCPPMSPVGRSPARSSSWSLRKPRRDETREKRWTPLDVDANANVGGKRERRFSLRGERQKSGEGEEEREEFAARTGASFQFGVALLKGEGKFTARVGRVKIYYWSWNGPRLRGPRTEQRTVKLRRKSNNDGPPRCGRETARPVLSE